MAHNFASPPHWFRSTTIGEVYANYINTISPRRCCFELTCWCLWRDSPQTKRADALISLSPTRFLATTSRGRRGESISRGSIVARYLWPGWREESTFPMSIWRRCRKRDREGERPNLNLISVLEGRYRIEETVSIFLHPLAPHSVAIPAKGCFTFMACLWYLMDSETSKHPLYTTRARVLYSRLVGIVFSIFCTHYLQDYLRGSFTCSAAFVKVYEVGLSLEERPRIKNVQVRKGKCGIVNVFFFYVIL